MKNVGLASNLKIPSAPKAFRFLIQYPSTCCCQVGFFAMASIETQYRNYPLIGDDMCYGMLYVDRPLCLSMIV